VTHLQASDDLPRRKDICWSDKTFGKIMDGYAAPLADPDLAALYGSSGAFGHCGRGDWKK